MLQVLLVGLYLLLCVLYWAWSALQLAAELRDVLDVKHFINNKLGISDRQVGLLRTTDATQSASVIVVWSLFNLSSWRTKLVHSLYLQQDSWLQQRCC